MHRAGSGSPPGVGVGGFTLLLWLARAAEPVGLLLVLDDIQWADEPSPHLVRQLRGVRMPILTTCRDPAPPGNPGGELIRALSADANTERVVLTGLPPVAVAALLASAGLDTPTEQAPAVQAETGGNPFRDTRPRHRPVRRRDWDPPSSPAGADADRPGHRGADTPDRLPDLRHDLTQHIVSIYQFDISSRQLAVARLTREPR